MLKCLSILICFKWLLGLCNKLEALGKKNCGKWARSLINHLYWCISSTADSNPEVITAKWLSVVNYIHIQHSGHGDLFPKCIHGRIKRKCIKQLKLNISWLTWACMDGCEHFLYTDTKASENLTAVLTNTRLLKDISRLSCLYQTSSLESVLLHFAPKSIAFSYEGMDCRYE